MAGMVAAAETAANVAAEATAAQILKPKIRVSAAAAAAGQFTKVSATIHVYKTLCVCVNDCIGIVAVCACAHARF